MGDSAVSPGRTETPDGVEIALQLAKISDDAKYVGVRDHALNIDEDVFAFDRPNLKQDIIRMIIQYLENEGYNISMMTLEDEAKVKVHEHNNRKNMIKKMKLAILDGDWVEVEKIAFKHQFKNLKNFIFDLNKQQYLELIERQEFQKAFTFLTKRLKPLESFASSPEEFKDMCYLLTCRSVQDAPSFRNWVGVAPARANLVERFENILDLETAGLASANALPPNRLLHLLKQALTYQIEFSRYQPRSKPKINTLLEDYQCFVMPNACKQEMKGHTENVKSVAFLGKEGRKLVSGSSDHTVRIWDTQSGVCEHVLSAHGSRVWCVDSDPSGNMVVSGSGDGTAVVWGDLASNPRILQTLKGHERDVYSVSFHPGGEHVVTGGYDKTVRLYSTNTGHITKTFTGHNGSVSCAIFNPYGNLIISGSKDSTVKFWDIVSGLCINTYSSRLGEVTSVQMNSCGNLLLTSAKDNSNRLWDVRLGRPVRKFKGHQNSSKNFIRSCFGPASGDRENLIVGASEDGDVYIWDNASGSIIERLVGHKGIVYSVVWNDKQSALATCSEDKTVRTWWYDPSVPFSNPNQGSSSALLAGQSQ